MVFSTLFFVAAAFNVVVFLILVMAVLTVFNIYRRTKVIEIRLLDLQDDLRLIKQELLRARPESGEGAKLVSSPKTGDA